MTPTRKARLKVLRHAEKIQRQIERDTVAAVTERLTDGLSKEAQALLDYYNIAYKKIAEFYREYGPLHG